MLQISVSILLLVTCSVNGAKILGMFFVPSISHQVVFQPIWKELSLRGHEVTVITPNPLKDPSLTNLTEIDVSFTYDLIGELDLSKTITHWEIVELLFGLTSGVIEADFNHPEVANILNDKNRKFDLVLVEYLNPIPSALSVRFNCPFIGIASLSTTSTGHEAAGTPVHPILHPDLMTTFGDDLTFFERVESVLYTIWYRYTYNKHLKGMDQIARKYIGEDIPHLSEIERNVSMVFLNTNPIIHKPRPFPPSVLELGRMHIKSKKPLPQDLKTFLDDAKEGAIYFSLGSNVKSVYINAEKRKIIMQTFAELPYKVLWKFENDTLEGKPNNVKIGKWLPQQDILAHPNIKLFITQGGLQSMEESIGNGVPLLGIPFFADQFYNVERIQALGIGLHLEFKTLTKESLKKNILEIIKNPKYKNKVIEVSEILNDNPISGLDKAVWWIEYVLRHKGAKYLKNPAVYMPWYQFLLLDVVGFLLICVLSVGFVIYKIIASTNPNKPNHSIGNKTKKVL